MRWDGFQDGGNGEGIRELLGYFFLLRVIKLDASEVGSKRLDRAERGGQDVTVAGLCTVPKCSGLIARLSPPSPSRRFPLVCRLAPRL